MKKAIMITTVVALFFVISCHKDPQNGGNDNDDGVTPHTSYFVTFYANGGVGDMQPQSFNHGETKALKANVFTYKYRTFINWNTAIDGTGTAYADQQEVTLTENLSLYAQWDSLKGDLNGHEWIDIGLPSGLLWATCNLGADAPEASGDYYAWGETETKAKYNWSTYKYANGNGDMLTKYCNDASHGDNGYCDTLTRLLPEDDAATVNWGTGWRMPTSAEFEELKDNCTVTWVTQNGVSGRLFTGPNGKSVFLPAAGCRWGSTLAYFRTRGYYLSASLATDQIDSALSLVFHSSIYFIYVEPRYFGLPVRPVCSLPMKK